MPPSPSAPRQRLKIGDLWVDSLTFAEALDRIEALVEAGQGGSVFTPNVDHVVNVGSNPAFREAYATASLSLVDGKPLLWASSLLGLRLPEKISGSDLLIPLMERAARKRWRVYLLGAAPGVAEQAAALLGERYGVTVCGYDSPMLKPGDASQNQRLVKNIREAKADLLVVAFGAPKQELFIKQVEAELRPAVCIALGASLDFLVGAAKRSPRWMSEFGLEWLYRLASEPRRMWKRYLVNDPRFVWILFKTLRVPRSERVEGVEPR